MFRAHVGLIVGVLFLAVPGQAPAQNPTLKTLMRAKLVNSQRLFESLVTADYAAIRRDADALSRITDKEIVSWQMGVQAEYQKQATLFVLSVRGLQQAAADRNIDAALHEYTTLTSSCVHCHAHVRRIARVTDQTRSPR